MWEWEPDNTKICGPMWRGDNQQAWWKFHTSAQWTTSGQPTLFTSTTIYINVSERETGIRTTIDWTRKCSTYLRHKSIKMVGTDTNHCLVWKKLPIPEKWLTKKVERNPKLRKKSKIQLSNNQSIQKIVRKCTRSETYEKIRWCGRRLVKITGRRQCCSGGFKISI